MIDSIAKMVAEAQRIPTKTLAVAAAQDSEVLLAVREAADTDLIKAVLIGDRDEIKKAADDAHVAIDDFPILQEADKRMACERAVRMTSAGETQMVMKGIVDTAVIMREALNKEYGLRTGKLLSQTTLIEVEGFDRLIYLTDAAINIAPDVDTKQKIIENAVELAHMMGLADPVVGCICAIEKVNPKMQATLDAAELVRRNQEGLITGCRVGGPYALDNALYVEAARRKGINDPLAGHADIVLVPAIEAGNVMYKCLMHMMHAAGATTIMGTRAPIVITSRSDHNDAKLYSIALSVLMANGGPLPE